MINKKYSQGFSLVELLLAMLVGLIIISGAFSLHSATRETQRANEAQMDMVADARFAIEMIAYDLRHVGLWGLTNQDGFIDCKSTNAPCTSNNGTDIAPSTVTNDCASGGGAPIWAYNLTEPIMVADGGSGNPFSGTCIPASEGHISTTDILQIKYADSNSQSGVLKDGQMYIRSNYTNGRVFVGNKPPLLKSGETSSISSNFALRAYAYYISDYTDTVGDGIPSLRRAALVNGPAVENQLLISGVVDLQVQLGENLGGTVDANGNMTIDTYVNPNDVSNWADVHTAKIWLIMRGDKKQDVAGIKSFEIAGNPPVNYGADGYRYFMVTSVVNLRNLKKF